MSIDYNHFLKYKEQIQRIRMSEKGDFNDARLHNSPRRLNEVAYNQTRKLIGLRHINRIADMVMKVKKDNRVLITCLDYSYLDSFFVSYTTSRLWRFPNFFVVAVDKRAYDVLDYLNIPVALIKSSKTRTVVEGQKQNDYGGHNFNQIVKLKLVAARKILSMNVSVLLFDSDIIIFKEPFSGLPKNDSFDFIAQKDETVCTGFIYFLPTVTSMRLIELALQQMERQEIHDQEAILAIIDQKRLPELQFRLFHPPDYNRGNIFFEKHQFSWKPVGTDNNSRITLDPNVVMAHNNYVIGRDNKVYRLKETGLYNMDIDGEYSSLTAKYLVLDQYGESEDTHALKVFVQIANALNRHLVLPTFPCLVKAREDKECNLCGFQPINCQKDIMRIANLPWKEHVFFHNKYVPDVVKQDYLNAPSIIFASDKSSCKEIRKNTTRHIKCLIMPSTVVSQGEIKEWFEQLEDQRVIRLFKIPQELNVF